MDDDRVKARQRFRICPTTMPTLPGGAIIRPSNGPFTLRNGSIAVGRHRLSGLLVDTADCFDHLVRRIRRCLARGEPVTLTIR